MLFKVDDNTEIIFTANVLEVFKEYQQIKNSQNEAGGYLYGQFDGYQVIVSHASIPKPFELKSRYRFKRNKFFGQYFANFLWTRSKKMTILLGEWHTHPDPSPKPSALDLEQCKLSFIGGKFLLNMLIFVIVGNESLSNMWVGIQTYKSINRLQRTGYQLWYDVLKTT